MKENISNTNEENEYRSKAINLQTQLMNCSQKRSNCDTLLRLSNVKNNIMTDDYNPKENSGLKENDYNMIENMCNDNGT